MRNKAFTLIEVLVVMTIIGVLASVVLVSFSGQREKAKLTVAKQFDAQVSHALGAYAAGIWRFEEGSGTALHDESGFANDGTFHGNPTPVFPTGVYSGTTALEFDGSNDYVDCGNNASLNITDAITIEAWVKADILTNWGVIVSKNVSPSWVDGGYNIHFYNDELIFWINNYLSNRVSISFTDTTNWHHIVGTYDKNAGSNQIKIYRDGVEGTSDTYTGSITTAPLHFTIGKACDSSTCFFDGAIDNVAIYDEALSSTQIQQHYAAGATIHGITLK